MTSESRHPLRSKRALVAITIIAVVAVSLILWQFSPAFLGKEQKQALAHLLPMNLTLVGFNGTSVVLNERDIAALPSFESKGGFKTSVGRLAGIGNYTGVRVSVLLAMVGGLDGNSSLRVTAEDGYSMVYNTDQVQGLNFTGYSPATGDETAVSQPFTVALAYHMNGMNFSVNDGPLRFAILSPQGLLTDGHYWIKMVTKLEVLPAVKEWTLVLRGALTENMTRGTFESGVNCPTAHHGINWTDSNNNVWAGMPLWLLLGRVDDSDMHTTTSSVSPFNDTLALEGYTVKVTTGQGYSVEFNSTEVMHNPNFVVAYKLNGAPLPDPYWPLKLVGFAVPSEKRMSNITEIQIIFGS